MLPTHWLICAQVPDPEQGDQLRPVGHTKKSHRRKAATQAVRGTRPGRGGRVPTCVEVAAAAVKKAVAMASDDSATPAGAAIVAVRAARVLDAAAKDLDRAPLIPPDESWQGGIIEE